MFDFPALFCPQKQAASLMPSIRIFRIDRKFRISTDEINFINTSQYAR